ncbi:MAG: HAMP domain-containing sensor histidine kinase [Cyanobacteria bacterium]|nr:HAMP domain-containing sensor histidine kinase [Cyanobacteriota bacterium]
MGFLLAALLGLGIGLLLPRPRGPGRRPFNRLERTQLIRWLNSSPSGWLIVDPADQVILINHRAERLLDVLGAALMHTPPLTRVCPAPELTELIRDARLRQRTQRLEWQRSGQELVLFALPGEGGWVALVLQSRRSLEAQLEQQERWVSDVAHELKTPLTALLLVGDSLAAQVNSGNAVLVERLQRELLRLQELVGDLLQLSRLENTLPRDGLRRSEVDMPQLVQQVWVGLRPLAEERHIRLELKVVGRSQGLSQSSGNSEAPTATNTSDKTVVQAHDNATADDNANPSAPGTEPLNRPHDSHPDSGGDGGGGSGGGGGGEIQIQGDRSLLHRALLNLIDNALRYSPDGGCVWVRVQSTDQWCLLTVRDEGPGLSEEDQERLFERFYRGDPSRVRSRRGGSGLGLAIVQQIALTHGGRVQAGNHPDGGARLELLLPVGG